MALEKKFDHPKVYSLLNEWLKKTQNSTQSHVNVQTNLLATSIDANG